jgi:hypothetical protein
VHEGKLAYTSAKHYRETEGIADATNEAERRYEPCTIVQKYKASSTAYTQQQQFEEHKDK